MVLAADCVSVLSIRHSVHPIASVQAADLVPACSGTIILGFSGWAELLSAKGKSTQLLK